MTDTNTNDPPFYLDATTHQDQEDQEDDDASLLDDTLYDTDSTGSGTSYSSQRSILRIVPGLEERTIVGGLSAVDQTVHDDLGRSPTKRPWLSLYNDSTGSILAPKRRKRRRLRSIQTGTGQAVARRVSSTQFQASPHLYHHPKAFDMGAALEADPGMILDLCHATQSFYELPETQKDTVSSSDQAPPEPRLEEASVQPVVHHPDLNDPNTNLSRHMVPTLQSPAAMTTFRQALAPGEHPKLVTLATPPFLVVNVNDAGCRVTNRAAHDILGKPLHQLFSKDYQADSVTMLHDQLAPIRVANGEATREDSDKTNGSPRTELQCLVRVTLIGPEPAVGFPPEQDHDGQAVSDNPRGVEDETDDTNLFVTHYGVELQPVAEKDAPAHHPSLVHLVSAPTSTTSRSSSSLSGRYCGILG